MKPSGMVTLLTDFGTQDPYAAMMKGVILSVNPRARIVDISHHIQPGAVDQAARMLQETFPYFPQGTVHVAVVDPGVGTERRAVAARIDSHLFVGPDNGIFWPIIETCQPAQIIHLCERGYFLPEVSDTFHGRDLFAPAAGHLSLGVSLREMGPIIRDPVRLLFSRPSVHGGDLYGRVVRVDRFGNLISNIRRLDMERFSRGDPVRIQIGALAVDGTQRTYGQAAAGEALALFGSLGCLEIAVNRGRAVDRIGIAPAKILDQRIRVRRMPGQTHHS